jgi:peptidoglycan/LPS O-acetylase OafA/YrhL
MDYPLQDMAHEPAANAKPTRRRSRWVLLLILPYLGLCFPQIYAHSTPVLWGFPFFYWYQFAWVIGASALLAIVYRKLKT